MAIDLESTYRRYGPMVLRRCRWLLRDEEKALDAMHDVFVQLLRRRESLYETKPSSLLFRIATNVCLNVLRGEKRHPCDGRDELLLGIASADVDTEERTVARHMLDAIFAREHASTRAIAVMHLVDGMSHEEVAREVGMSVSGVRKRLRTLRARLNQEEVTP